MEFCHRGRPSIVNLVLLNLLGDKNPVTENSQGLVVRILELPLLLWTYRYPHSFVHHDHRHAASKGTHKFPIFLLFIIGDPLRALRSTGKNTRQKYTQDDACKTR